MSDSDDESSAPTLEEDLHCTLKRLHDRLGNIERRLDALAPGVDKMDRHVDFVESAMTWAYGLLNRLPHRLGNDTPQGRLGQPE